MSNKVEIKIMFEAEKLDALEVFLAESNSSVQKKLAEDLQQLYEKTVPEPVRKFVDSKTGTKPRRSTSSGSSQARARTPSAPQKEAGAHGQSEGQPATE